MPEPAASRPEHTRGHRRDQLVVSVAILATFAVPFLFAVLGGRAGSRPADFPERPAAVAADERVSVTIPPGATLTQIGRLLADAGVVASAQAFTKAAAAVPDARTVPAGEVRLPRGLPARVALDALLGRGPAALRHVTVPAGATAARITDLLAAAGVDRADITAALAAPPALGVPAAAPSVEGWLAPGSYDVEPSADARAVLTTMVTRQRETLRTAGVDADADPAGAQRLLTVASLAQAEARPDQYGQVARVVENRLARGMRLQLDATLNYAHGTRILAHDAGQLADPSAYNSYRHTGLPPTPIGNPDIRALRAAVAPPAGNWLFFVLVDADGRMLFTADYQQFLRAKAAARAAGLF